MGINLDEVYAGKNLNAGWLKTQPEGRLTLTIKSVGVENMASEDEKPDRKVVLHFTEIPKALALNKTNKNMAIELLGRDTDSWIGKTINIKAERTDYGGERVDCIRIQDPESGKPQPQIVTDAGKVLGAAAVAKLTSRLEDTHRSLANLRAYLTGKVAPASSIEADPATWPASWGGTIKAFLDTTVEMLNPEDIPF